MTDLFLWNDLLGISSSTERWLPALLRKKKSKNSNNYWIISNHKQDEYDSALLTLQMPEFFVMRLNTGSQAVMQM